MQKTTAAIRINLAEMLHMETSSSRYDVPRHGDAAHGHGGARLESNRACHIRKVVTRLESKRPCHIRKVVTRLESKRACHIRKVATRLESKRACHLRKVVTRLESKRACHLRKVVTGAGTGAVTGYELIHELWERNQSARRPNSKCPPTCRAS